MLLININTNKFPYAMWELRQEYADWNVYQPLPDGIFQVVEAPAPEGLEDNQYFEPGQPELIDGVWTLPMVVKDRPFGYTPTGPGPWDLDQESGLFYLAHPLAKATHD